MIPFTRQPVGRNGIDSQETKPISVQLPPSQPASNGQIARLRSTINSDFPRRTTMTHGLSTLQCAQTTMPRIAFSPKARNPVPNFLNVDDSKPIPFESALVQAHAVPQKTTRVPARYHVGPPQIVAGATPTVSRPPEVLRF